MATSTPTKKRARELPTNSTTLESKDGAEETLCAQTEPQSGSEESLTLPEGNDGLPEGITEDKRGKCGFIVEFKKYRIKDRFPFSKMNRQGINELENKTVKELRELALTLGITGVEKSRSNTVDHPGALCKISDFASELMDKLKNQ